MEQKYETSNNSKPMAYDTLLGVVTCPNRCLAGQVKYYPNPERALFDLRTCQYCKGKGEVTEEEAKKIEAIL